jgi:Domain of unknown function (DUF697)
MIVTLLLLLVWGMTTAVVEYARVRRSLLSEPLDVPSLQHDVGVNWDTLRSLRGQLEKELSHLGVGLPPADLAELQAVRSELGTWPTDNTRQWLLRYDRELLMIIDRVVADCIRREVANIAILTALSPRRGFDFLFVFWRQLRLVRSVAVFYGWRPGLLGTFTLVRHVLVNATLAAGLEDLGDLTVEAFPAHKVAAFAGGIMTEAVGNAAFTLRLARRGVDACRPLKNRKAVPYRVTLLQTVMAAGFGKTMTDRLERF